MSMYYSFNDFMDKVLESAREKSEKEYGMSLEEYFKAAAGKIGIVKVVLEHGSWVIFGIAAALLILGTVAVEMNANAFTAIPVGAAGAIIIGGMAAGLVKKRYVKRCFAMAVNEIKKNYRSIWEKAEGNIRKINWLAEEACSDLLKKAENRKY